MKKRTTASAVRNAFLVVCATASVGAFAGTTWTVSNVTELVSALGAMSDMVTAGNYTSGYPHKILLEKGVYDLGEVEMSDGNHLEVNLSLEFTMEGLGEGPGDVILLGGGAAKGCRVIHNRGGSNYGSSYFRNLTITGGYSSGDGAGVLSDSVKTYYENCIVSNNVSTSSGVGHAGGGCSGGVAIGCVFADNVHPMAAGGMATRGKHYFGDFTPYVENCVFSNNQQTVGYNYYYGGGAVASMGPISGCRFYNNSAVYGGAVGPSEGVAPPEVSNCLFVGNVASVYGGATYNVKRVVGCTFEKNTAGQHGGGSYANDMSIYDSAFTSNRTESYDGGAAFGYGMVVSNCVLTGNYARRAGGALYFYDSSNKPSHAYDCRFVGNSSYGNGGALSLAGYAASSAEGCYFESNVAGNDASSAYGGGVYSSRLSLVTNCVFCGAHSARAGGFAVYNCNVYDSTFRNYEGRGFIISNCNLYNCFVTNNLCSNFGTWAYERHLESNESGERRESVNCVYADNVHSGSAGYSLVYGKDLVNCTFVSNSIVLGNYGYMYKKCTFVNSLLTGNSDRGTYIDVTTHRNIDGQELPAAEALELTNCVYSALQLNANTNLFWHCRQIQVAGLKLSKNPATPYAPRASSPLCRDSLEDPWVLALVGDRDVYGNPRVVDGKLDVGAAESDGMRIGTIFTLY